jgi:hypothetical protein
MGQTTSVIASQRSEHAVIPSERSEHAVIPSERSESRDLHLGKCRSLDYARDDTSFTSVMP